MRWRFSVQTRRVWAIAATLGMVLALPGCAAPEKPAVYQDQLGPEAGESVADYIARTPFARPAVTSWALVTFTSPVSLAGKRYRRREGHQCPRGDRRACKRGARNVVSNGLPRLRAELILVHRRFLRGSTARKSKHHAQRRSDRPHTPSLHGESPAHGTNPPGTRTRSPYACH